MTPDTYCPRCGHLNSFFPGRLPGTCVCSICQSQLDWRQIPGSGEDCRPLEEAPGLPAEELPGPEPAPLAAESAEAPAAEPGGTEPPTPAPTPPTGVATSPGATASERVEDQETAPPPEPEAK